MERERVEQSRLSDSEKETLLAYIEDKLPMPGSQLAPSLVAQFYKLFLEGYTAEKIQELNPQYPLGAILHAQVKFDWDAKRDAYSEQLQKQVVERLMNTTLEAVNFVSDLLAVSHKKYGGQLKKYLQTGNEEELKGNMMVNGLLGYQKAVELLQKLTGQDKAKAPTVPPSAQSAGSVIDVASTPVRAALPPGEARVVIRKALAAKTRK